ncbi:DUF434 domain-containing protein [Thermococcus sp.]|uniref:DUF434 domain-containing protein n=1 Tax=Thermococcus sp. TaxID=35749 RepID=UPI00262F6FE4|nr:DUF434 domain-containing protein [Thermococcus sp.]
MLLEAYLDLKYLLNRGYRKKGALEFVANHYRLTGKERHLLARCVFPDSWIEEVRRKLLKPGDLRGLELAVDGFNVLITTESLIEGRAVLCEDGLLRDLKYQGKYRVSGRTGQVVETVLKGLAELRVGRAVFFYGKNVPKSGLVKKLTLEKMAELGLNGEVVLVRSPDFKLKSFENVATADVGIISKVSGVFDVPLYLSGKVGKPVDFRELISTS